MQKFYINYLLVFSFFVSLNAYCQDENPGRTIKVPESRANIIVLDTIINLYQAGDFFISGQPTDSLLHVLMKKGLGLIINVRTPEEMEALKKDGFDEETFAATNHLPYVNVPLGGDYGFSKESIEKIHQAIQLHEGNVMIHCRRAGRATNAWMAWLINYNNTPVNDAVSLGREMQFTLYLEDLLGYALTFDPPASVDE